MDEEKHADLLRQIRSQIDSQKRDVRMYFAELKLKLPTYLKNLKLQELRDAGALLEPDCIILPKKTEDQIRNRADYTWRNTNLLEAVKDWHLMEKSKVRSHYKTMKDQIAKDLLHKKLEDLTHEEWNILGIDIEKFRKVINEAQQLKTTS